MDERTRMEHFRSWGFSSQAMNGNPMLKTFAGSAVFNGAGTIAEHTAAVMLNGPFTERKASFSEAQAVPLSMGYHGNPWAMFPPAMSSVPAPEDNMDLRVKEMHNVLGFPSEEVDTGDPNDRPAKRRKPRASKSPNSDAAKVPKPRQPRKKNSSSASKRAGSFPSDKSDKKVLDIVVNGATYDISGIPVPVCSCTGVPHQCYRWGAGGWQSSCCTTSMSAYPLPLSHTRPGARIAGRKMSNGAYRKVLEKVAAEGHDLSTAVDLKNFWAKHGTNKFVTIR
ncbi:unnamed protein product [Victoria cruziana]